MAFILDRGGVAGGAGVCVRAGALAGGAGANGALPPAGNGVGYGRSVRLEAFVFRAQNPFMNSNAMTYILLIILP